MKYFVSKCKVKKIVLLQLKKGIFISKYCNFLREAANFVYYSFLLRQLNANSHASIKYIIWNNRDLYVLWTGRLMYENVKKYLILVASEAN